MSSNVYELSTETAPRRGVVLHTGTIRGTTFGLWHKEHLVNRPVVFWLAGGGWGNADEQKDRSMISDICDDTGATVVVVKHTADHWNGLLDEMVNAIEIILPVHGSYSLAGVSSGGHIVLATLARLVDSSIKLPDHVYLVAPVVTIGKDSFWRCCTEPLDAINLSPKRLDHYISQTFADVEDPQVNPSQLPITMLRRMPEATIIALTDDILYQDIINAYEHWRSRGWTNLHFQSFEGPHYSLRLNKTSHLARRLRSELIEGIIQRNPHPELLRSFPGDDIVVSLYQGFANHLEDNIAEGCCDSTR